jgi:hypothetical protein
MWLALGLGLALLLLAHFVVSKRLTEAAPRRRLNADLVRVILSLEQKNLDDLFKLYAERFGQEAARYARRTYNKWKSGEVRPSKQTFNRLLVRLPEVMSFDLKCELLRKLREEFCAGSHYELTVSTGDWRDALAPLVTQLIDKSYTAQLPKQIGEKLGWLATNDMQIARAILAESQAQESRNSIACLEQEFANIERILAGGGRKSKITHTLKLPFGTIKLKIKRS